LTSTRIRHQILAPHSGMTEPKSVDQIN